MECTLQRKKFSSSSSLQCSSPNDSVCSFEFTEPSTKRRFSLRKRRSSSICDDSISVLSLDTHQGGKKRRLSRVASLASLISPARQIKKIAFQRSAATPPVSSCQSPGLEVGQKPRRSASTPTRATVKRSRQWLEKFPEEIRGQLKEQMSYWELRRQEAIYELYKGEKYMVKDLELVRQAYQGSIQCLGILQPQESGRIFGPLHTLLPVHQDLQEKLRSCRLEEDKSTSGVGRVLLEWVAQLEVYFDYCSHLVAAKEILESRRARSKELATFLDLCRQSGFSRRLDLWSFLDVPRSKLTKYPLLLKNILKYTRDPHEDRVLLPRVIEKVESIIQAVDKSMGQTICRHTLSQIHGLEKDSFILKATSLLCQGQLRNNRGTKLQGFLFDTGFLLARPLEDKFRLHKRPIPVGSLRLADATKMSSSSFKSAFSSNSSGRCTFGISNGSGEEFILSANDELQYKEWLQKLRSLQTVAPLRERNH